MHYTYHTSREILENLLYKKLFEGQITMKEYAKAIKLLGQQEGRS